MSSQKCPHNHSIEQKFNKVKNTQKTYNTHPTAHKLTWPHAPHTCTSDHKLIPARKQRGEDKKMFKNVPASRLVLKIKVSPENSVESAPRPGLVF